MKILINRSDAIGDLLLTLPMLQTLKKTFPECSIGLLISPRTKELITLFPNLVDEFWVIDKKDSFLSKAKILKIIFKSFTPSHYFYVGGDTIANTIAMLSGTPFRGGLLSKANTFLTLNNGVRQKRSQALMHESDYNLELLKPLNTKLNIDKNISVVFEDISDEKKQFQEILKDHDIDTKAKLIFVHPGMTGHTLNWPINFYSDFVVRLGEEKSNYCFVISHTPSDKKYIDEFNKHLPRDHKAKLIYFDGSKKGIVHYLKILSTADLFIGPSTGTTHMANLVGLKQIGIYSPLKVQSSKRWGPLRQDNRVQIMEPVLEYSELEKSDDDPRFKEAMSSLTVDRAIAYAKDFLEKGEDNGNAS